MYTLESLLHLGNPSEEQSNILKHMLDKGYKRTYITKSGSRKYSSK